MRRVGALTQIVILFVVAVLAAQVNIRRGFTRRLLIAIEVCAAIAGVYGILQYLGFDPLLPPQLYTVRFTSDVIRPPATLRHAIYFANFLIPVILMAASLAIHETRAAWRYFHLAVLSIAAAALLLTGTRSALLGLMAGAVLFGFVEARRIGKKRMLVYAAACAVAGLAFLSALAFSPAGKSFRVRLGQWAQDAKGGTRLVVWRDSWPLIAKYWLTGVGPEEFAGEFRRLQSLQLSQAYPDHYHEDPHNLLIGAAVSQGVLGLAILLGWLALGLFCAYRCVRSGIPEGGMLLAAIVGMTISEQFAPLTITNLLYFDFTIALAVALSAPAASNAIPITRAARTSVLTLTLIVAIAIAATAGLYLIPDALLAAADRRLAHGNVQGARESFRRAALFPFPADYLGFSQQMAAAARSLRAPWRQQALEAAKEASAAAEQCGDQRFSALYESAVLAVVSGDLRNAELKLRAAEDAAPFWYRAHSMLAQVLWLTHRNPEAEHEAALALECAGSQEPKVREALQSAGVVATKGN